MGVNTAQEVLDAESLTADVLDMAFVLLVNALVDQLHEFGRFTAQFLQVDVKRVVRTVHLASVMDEVFHLYVQQQRLVRILDIERVETAAFGDDRHVRLVTEIPDHRLYADNILRTVGLSRHKIRGTEVHIADGGGEDDVRGLVVGHFQPIRGNHPVKGEFPGQTVIEVAIPLTGVNVRCQRGVIGYCRCRIGCILCKSTHYARHKGKHYKNLFHVL
ncbi:putative uncharacterized protein [Bacteroides sp. CAG:754]|nr:putative uncharacterized protein [Bacteroides sp. CAG:754]